MTTPAMPMMATVDEPSRWRIDRRLTPVTAMIWDSMASSSSARRRCAGGPPASAGHGAGREPERDDHATPSDQIARRQVERRQEIRVGSPHAT